MKIVGGNFGVDGVAYVANGPTLVLQLRQKEQRFAASEIASVEARAESARKFSFLKFVVLGLILGLLLGSLAGVVGLLIGVVLAAVFALFHGDKTLVDIAFSSGQRVTLLCSRGGAQALASLKM